MDLTEQLLALLKGPTYVPQTLKGLTQLLGVRRKDERELKRIINYWVSTGELVRIKADRFCLPSDADLVTGILHVRPSGDARLAPIIEGPSIYIRADDSNVALHGDKVIVRRIRPLRVKGQRDSFPTDALFGRVIEVLSRARDTIVGTLQARRHVYFVIPDDTRIPQDILVSAPEPLGPGLKPKLGDKVVVKLLEWTHRHLNPVGEITEILGESHTPQAEYLGILHKYSLKRTA
ncbi:MAG: hypothetical protein B7X06_01425 [Verrucomicrobia bacterium 21-51-4]|nr:MAG: hypothetical protein B7X06_01425 [Verrucomicrobia bacterium 21-51-4]